MIDGVRPGAVLSNPVKKETRRIRLEARLEVLNELAGHLELDWTDDPEERAEGMRFSKRFHKQAEKVKRKLLLARTLQPRPFRHSEISANHKTN